MKSLIIFLALFNYSYATRFHSYHATPITEEELKRYDESNTTKFCTIDVNLPCDPTEWRRLDGSCNNLKHPTYGTIATKFLRVLEPVFGKDLSDKPSVKGGKLPLPRRLRTNILKVGKASDDIFTVMLSYHVLYMFTDIGSISDSVNYVLDNPHCCEADFKNDYSCTPQEIPDDDPVHRFSHVRCMNQTRPLTYQTHGCLKNGTTTPERINTETASLDQSSIYNYGGSPATRTLEGGQLAVDIVNGIIWPKLMPSKDNRLCILNKLPEEELCFKDTTNGVLGSKFIAIFMIRMHNYIARQLAKLNPCWDDERLFYTARDIINAIHGQIMYYEMMKELMGRKNLIKEGILSKSKGFRDLYDENVLPQVSEEFIFALRYFHTIQEADLKMYDNEGHYSHTYPVVNATLKTGVFLRDGIFKQLTQSSFRQAGGKFDHAVDPQIAEVGLGELNYVSDITTNDLAKSRTIGFQGYVKYLEYCSSCSNKKYRTFEDLLDVMDQEQMENLKDNYADVEDIDLMAGMWSERLVRGGHVPHTVYCLLADQLRRFIKSDRFWYERKDKPHALTEPQLHEIRKVTIASILCTVGDSVDKIQKHAFLRIGPKNPLVSCKEIPMIDLSKWKDNACECDNDNNIVQDDKKNDY